MSYSWRQDHEEKRKNKDLAHNRQKRLQNYGYQKNRKGISKPKKEFKEKKGRQTRFKHPKAEDF